MTMSNTEDNQPNIKSPKNLADDIKNIKDDEERLRRAVVAGSILGGILFFDYFTAEEWYEKNPEGDFIVKRKDLLKEIFE